MCESTIYLVKGSKRTLVMEEVARVVAEGSAITCINTFGERKVVEGAEIAEANLPRHEIVLRTRKS